MSPGNVSRHIGGLRDFGLPKVKVVAKRLYDISPTLNATIWGASALADMESLSKFIEAADIVVCTTADENAEAAINQIAVMTQKPVIYGRALRRGSVGRVFLVRPGVDACKSCLGHFARDAREGVETPNDWIEITEDDQDMHPSRMRSPHRSSECLSTSRLSPH